MSFKCLLTLLILGGFGFAIAQTPELASNSDREENSCSELHNATPGLFGLCMSYCEVLDCDESDDGSAACQNILDTYNRKRSQEDPLMPCAGCPCFTMEGVESVVSHKDFYRCGDYYDEEVRGTYYWSYQDIRVAGSFDDNGDAQVARSLYVIENDPQWPGFSCDWGFKDVKPFRQIQVHWDGNPQNPEDLSRFERCKAIFEQVVEAGNVPCETDPSCEIRVVLEWPYVFESPTIEIDGYLINEPLLECLNRELIVRVDWYWGDGSMDSFHPMSDGYVHPFPNSHTYSENGLYVWRVLAFDGNGKLVGSAGNFVMIMGL